MKGLIQDADDALIGKSLSLKLLAMMYSTRVVLKITHVSHHPIRFCVSTRRSY